MSTVAVAPPYPGLRPFREREALLFFGQDAAIGRLRQKVYHDRFVAILGLSGCGKSSLLKAGLLADLRDQQVEGPRARWIIGRMKPGSDPLGGLLQTADLVRQAVLEEKASFEECADQTRLTSSTLTSDTRGLARFGRAAKLRDDQRILIVIDQFEELFRFQREAATSAEKDRAVHFVQLLLTAVSDKKSGVSVVITMRSEFAGDCGLWYGLAERINRGTFLLPKMTRSQLEEVIVGPTEPCGFRIDSGVVQELLNETEKQDDGLPLLQHALRRIWMNWKARQTEEPISLTDLRHFTRPLPENTLLIKHHLDDHLDSIYRSLGERKTVAKLLFRALSERDSRGRLTRRAVLFDRDSETEGGPKREPTLMESIGAGRHGDLVAVIEEFRDEDSGRTFLTPGKPKPFAGQYVDISHECLLRRWNRLGNWITDEQEDYDNFRALAAAADAADLHATMTKRQRRPIEGTTLETFQKWRAKATLIGPEWALRYQGDTVPELGRPAHSFKHAMDYLEWSGKQARIRAANEKRTEEERIRAEERTRNQWWAIVGLAVAIVLIVAASAWAFSSRGKAEAAVTNELAAKAAADAVTLKEAREKAAWGEQETKRLAAEEEHSKNDLATANQNTFTAEAATLSSNDPPLALLAGTRAAAFGMPWPEKLEGILGAALTEAANYAVFNGHRGKVRTVAWNAQTRQLASAGDDGTIQLWNEEDGRHLRKWQGPTGSVTGISWSPDGRLLASAGPDGRIRLWSTDRQEPARTVDSGSRRVETVAWSPDGGTLAAGTADGTICLWDAKSPGTRRLGEPQASDTADVMTLAWSPDGETLASGGKSRDIRLWARGSDRPAITLVAGGVDSVAWSPDGRMLASVDGSNLRLWRYAGGTLTPVPGIDQKGFKALAWSVDGKTLASAENDGVIRLWKITDGSEALALKPAQALQSQGDVNSVAWSPDSRKLASAGDDGSVRLWEPGAESSLRREKAGSEVYAVSCNAGGDCLSGGLGGGLWFWSGQPGVSSRRLPDRSGDVYSVALSPDGKRFAWAGEDKVIHLAPLSGGAETLLAGKEGHMDWVREVAWSPDGSEIASASDDGTVRVWSASDGKFLRKLTGNDRKFLSVAWSPDGFRLAGGGSDGTVSVWTAATGVRVGTLPASEGSGREKGINSVSWSANGRWLASAGDDRTVRLWDGTTFGLVKVLRGHGSYALHVIWSADGKTVAASGADGTIRLWDPTEGTSRRVLKGHEKAVNSIAWTAAESRIVSGSSDETVRWWAGNQGELLNQVQRRTGLYRPSADECQRYRIPGICPK